MKQQNWNLHTHTLRCGHASGEDVQYIKSAIEAGFTLLGFSEHIPFPDIRIPGARMFCEQKDEYISAMRALQKSYEGSIDIKIGYEVEYFENRFDYLMQLREECDYMILGQHLQYMIYDYDSYCSDEDCLIYAVQVEEALKRKLFTYVAHPDYFMMGRRSFSESCAAAARRIAEASLQYDTPLEINLNGFSYGKKRYSVNGGARMCHPYPFREFWEIISAYGCKVVFGYDAHSPLTLLERERETEALELLKGLPLNFVDEVILR